MFKIAIDVDEVLTPFLPTMMKWKPPKTKLTKYPYVYRTIYGTTEKESQKLVRDFYQSSEFRDLRPIEDSQKVLTQLKKENKLYVVTARQTCIQKQTEEWIEKWYPGIFTDVILTNGYTENEIKKVDVCKILNIGLIVDDNLWTCTECMDGGIKAVNFIGDPVYPWCYENNISIKSWRELYNGGTVSGH